MLSCLAPMDWITDCAYRTICKEIFLKHGAQSDQLMLWTEFMSADWYYHNPPGVVRHLLKTDFEPELIAQIFWGNEETLIKCAIDIEQRYDFGGIELNMWCPSPKIMKCAAWSGMLRDKKKTLSILKQISEQITLPFSLKTRTGLSQDDVDEQFDFLLEASKYVWMIGVHGRTYGQSHSGFVNREFIYKLKERLPDKVIIWNGGIRTYQQGVEQCWNLDGVMTAQSAIWNPRVLTPYQPTAEERLHVIIRHLNLAMAEEHRFREKVEQMNETLEMPTYKQLNNLAKRIDQWDIDTSGNRKTPREMRKFLFNYIIWLPDNKTLKRAIIKITDYMELKTLLASYFKKLS